MTTENKPKNSKAVLFERFIRLHCKTNDVDFKLISKILIEKSMVWRPAVWGQYKSAIVERLIDRGLHDDADRIQSLFNPVTSPDSPASIKARKPKAKPRCHKVTEAEHEKLMRYLVDKKDCSLYAVLNLAYHTGMRPAEMLNIRFIPSTYSIDIKSAKKTEDGMRSIDRTLTFSKDDYLILEDSNKYLVEEQNREEFYPERAMRRIQNRLYDAVRKVWPRRKTHITLYSYRHQLGSNLKASGWDPITVSAIMGHQSVNSIEAYGNARSTTRTPNIKVSEQARNLVRNTLLKVTDFETLEHRYEDQAIRPDSSKQPE